MAMDPFCILKAFGMCKEPPVEQVQPRWWDGYQHPLPPPPGRPRHRNHLPAVPPHPPTRNVAGASAAHLHHPSSSSSSSPQQLLTSGGDRRSLTPPPLAQRNFDAVVLDTPTELRCFVPEYSLGRSYAPPLQGDTTNMAREEKDQHRLPFSSFPQSSRRHLAVTPSASGGTPADVGSQKQFVGA
eukprot:GHVS01008061.1.p1 GENE.GHVS01008061.1~~GHVS01008061.1.p1  ORF type:complete len:184 (-),score=47.13 GHVS01008061.1:549-1100(-)